MLLWLTLEFIFVSGKNGQIHKMCLYFPWVFTDFYELILGYLHKTTKLMFFFFFLDKIQ